MPAVYVDASDLRFPQRCSGCDGPVEAIHNLQACRGIDLLVVSYFEFLDVPLPVCRRCKRHRRFVGLATYTGGVLFVIVGGFMAMELLMNELKLASAVLGALILVVALGLRIRGDTLIEWACLGVTVHWLKGAGTRLRLTFRRDQYFVSWLGVNQVAASSSGPMPGRSVKPTMSMNTPTLNTPTYSRLIPGATLGVMLVLLALHHWYAVTYKSVYPVVVLLLTLIAGFAAGGTVYAPLFYAAGAYGRHLPAYMKVISGLCAACGLATGFYLLFVIYSF